MSISWKGIISTPHFNTASEEEQKQMRKNFFTSKTYKFTRDDLESELERLAPKYGVDSGFVRNVLAAESNWNAGATSPKGAQGLMQLMRGTAEDEGVDLSDPASNLEGGISYLSKQLKKYGGDKVKAAAAYNWGPGNVDKHIKMWGDLNIDELPKETKNYIAKVSGLREQLGREPTLVDVPHGSLKGRGWKVGEKRKIQRIPSQPKMEYSNEEGYETGEIPVIHSEVDDSGILQERPGGGFDIRLHPLLPTEYDSSADESIPMQFARNVGDKLYDYGEVVKNKLGEYGENIGNRLLEGAKNTAFLTPENRGWLGDRVKQGVEDLFYPPSVSQTLQKNKDTLGTGLKIASQFAPGAGGIGNIAGQLAKHPFQSPDLREAAAAQATSFIPGSGGMVKGAGLGALQSFVENMIENGQLPSSIDALKSAILGGTLGYLVRKFSPKLGPILKGLEERYPAQLNGLWGGEGVSQPRVSDYGVIPQPLPPNMLEEALTAETIPPPSLPAKKNATDVIRKAKKEVAMEQKMNSIKKQWIEGMREREGKETREYIKRNQPIPVLDEPFRGPRRRE